MDWDERADQAQAALQREFLAPLGLPWLARLRSPPRIKDRFSASYWWQAQLLDLYLDALERNSAVVKPRQVGELIRGQRLANGGHLRRDYYDDMQWMGIALARAGRNAEAEQLWVLCRDAWNDAQGGGIPWRIQQPTYKNTAANGPAAILAARLGHRDWAERIVDWMETRLIDTAGGEVIDGIDRQGDGKADRDWQFSYNYGVALAAELALGRRETAERIAAAGLERCAPDGILKSEGDGDGALFKGVFARYLAALNWEPGLRVVRDTAEAFWQHRDAKGRFGPDPRITPPRPVELPAMLSGVMVLEAAARSFRR